MKLAPRWVKEWMCRRWCPKYLEHMPEEDIPGEFIASSFLFGFAHRMDVNEREVEGLVNAYKEARWMALWADFWSRGSPLGVGYSVRSARQKL